MLDLGLLEPNDRVQFFTRTHEYTESLMRCLGVYVLNSEVIQTLFRRRHPTLADFPGIKAILEVSDDFEAHVQGLMGEFRLLMYALDSSKERWQPYDFDA